MLQPFRVHLSLVRPPLLLGVERRLAFLVVSCGLPFITLGGFAFRNLLVIAAIEVVGLFLARKATTYDQDTLTLYLNSTSYSDFYQPLAHPSRRPLQLRKH